MGFLSRFEGKMEDTVEGAAGKLSRSPISPVQIAKKCEKQMLRSKMVGAGKQYAPTLYTVLVNPDDDANLFSFYPTLAGETETYLKAKSAEQGLYMDGQPLVRFIVDDGLRHGKFDVIAEVVASAIIVQLRQEEMERYGIAAPSQAPRGGYAPQRQQPASSDYQSDYNNDYYDDPYANDPYESEPYPSDPYEPSNYDDYGSASGKIDPYAPQTTPADAMMEAAPVAAAEMRAMDARDPYAEPVAEAPTQLIKTSVPQLINMETNRIIELDMPTMIVGRSNDCDIVIPDINASRNHAELIEQGAGFWFVRDLGSKNGTLVNGRTIQQPTELRSGDRLTIGLTEFIFNEPSQPIR